MITKSKVHGRIVRFFVQVAFPLVFVFAPSSGVGSNWNQCFRAVEGVVETDEIFKCGRICCPMRKRCRSWVSSLPSLNRPIELEGQFPQSLSKRTEEQALRYLKSVYPFRSVIKVSFSKNEFDFARDRVPERKFETAVIEISRNQKSKGRDLFTFVKSLYRQLEKNGVAIVSGLTDEQVMELQVFFRREFSDETAPIHEFAQIDKKTWRLTFEKKSWKENSDSATRKKYERLEDEAIGILKRVALSKAEALREVRLWLENLGKRASAEEMITPLEHISLVYILRSGFLDTFVSPGNKEIMTELLKKSWKQFGIKKASDQSLVERLPRKVLRRLSEEERTFHSFAFESKIGSGASWKSMFLQRIEFFKDWVPLKRDFAVLTSVLAVALTNTGGEVLAGALMGMSVVSLVEYGLHKYAGHAPRGFKKLIKGWSWLAKDIENTHTGHTKIHHNMVGYSYDVERLPLSAKQRIDKRISELGLKGEAHLNSGYGLSLTPQGALKGFLLSTPIYAGLMWTLDLGFAATLGLWAPSSLFVLASKNFHPYLHLTRERAMQKASPPMRWFLGSRYAEMMARYHYAHHFAPDANYNLVFLGDWILGKLQKPTMKQVLRMHELGFIGAKWN